MTRTGENLSIGRKICVSVICSPRVLHALNWVWTRSYAFGGRRLTAHSVRGTAACLQVRCRGKEKLLPCLIKHEVVKTCGGVEVQLHLTFNLTPSVRSGRPCSPSLFPKKLTLCPSSLLALVCQLLVWLYNREGCLVLPGTPVTPLADRLSVFRRTASLDT